MSFKKRKINNYSLEKNVSVSTRKSSIPMLIRRGDHWDAQVRPRITVFYALLHDRSFLIGPRSLVIVWTRNSTIWNNYFIQVVNKRCSFNQYSWVLGQKSPRKIVAVFLSPVTHPPRFYVTNAIIHIILKFYFRFKFSGVLGKFGKSYRRGLRLS